MKFKLGSREIDLGFRRDSRKDQSSLGKEDFGSTNAWGYYSTKGPEKVSEYYAPTIKAFSTFKTVEGDVTINYSILEGLYRKTIAGRIIKKLAGDATRIGFTFKVTNKDDTPNEKAQEIVDEIQNKIRRRDLTKVFRDRELYGDAFLYVQRGETEGITDIERIFAVNPRYIWPHLDDYLEITGWFYNSKARGAIEIDLDSMVHIPRDPITGQLFGVPLMESIIQTLHLLLNSQLNIAIILDHFALPILHWKIDSKDDKRKTPVSELRRFMKKLARKATGGDLVTDSSVSSEVIGINDKVIDFSPLLDKLDQYLFITAGIPGSLMGAPADNLSAITRQLQSYYDDIFDTQEAVADYFIEDLFRPELEKRGYKDIKIVVTHNTPQIEQPSRTATVITAMIKAGVMTRKQGMEWLGIAGEPPKELDVLPDPNQIQQPENTPDFDKKSGNPKPPIGRS